LLFAHAEHEPPPQSVSVSAPFFTPSLQLAAAQNPPLQIDAEQSLALPQVLPAEHFEQVVPPQSMSASSWFLIPSEHVAGAVHRPVTQVFGELQSLVTAQRFPAAQRLPAVAQAPPQSVSDSSWFFTPSLHVAARHVPPVQIDVWQSAATEQTLPLAHAVQLPPQSVSVSLPFLMLSPQEAGAVQKPPTQVLPATQLPSTEQRLPVAHEAQVPAPQSTSVSLPFFTPSLHAGVAQRPAVQTPYLQSAPTRHLRP
jgi:hypothetical protein